MANVNILNLPILVNIGGTEWMEAVLNNASYRIQTGQISSLTAGGNGSLPFPVSIGGTGQASFTLNGVLYGNTTNGLNATAAGTTGQVLIGNTGSAPTWAALTSSAVTSIGFGTTGLTPSVSTQGAVTVAGTLTVANGGTGAISLSGYLFGNGTNSFTASTTIPGSVITGTIDNVMIGQTTAAAISATTLSASSTVSGSGFSTYLASPPAIGGTIAAAISATTLSASSSILSSSASGGVGYKAGSGSTVTQITSRATGVTINTPTGAITMFTAAGSAGWSGFVVSNSSVTATDTVVLSSKNSINSYILIATSIGAGAFGIGFATTGGTASDTPIINYTIIKGSAS